MKPAKQSISRAAWAFCIAACAFAFQAYAQSIPTSNTGLVWDYVNTDAFSQGAKQFYLKEIVSNAQRAKIIATAEEECGGRYEGTSIHLTQFSHTINSDRSGIIRGEKEYTVTYTASTASRWLLVETLSCSFHGGHSQSVLHAVLLGGHESMNVIYRHANDREGAIGSPVINNVKRTYSIDAEQFQDQYKVPD